jgi:hypothetical protein
MNAIVALSGPGLTISIIAIAIVAAIAWRELGEKR